MMSIHFNALTDTFHHVPRTFSQLFLFLINFAIALFYWRLPSKFFKETLSTVGVRHRF